MVSGHHDSLQWGNSQQCIALGSFMAAAGSVRPRRLLGWQLLLLVVVVELVVPACCQQAAQFLPSGIPAVSAGVTQRLVFRGQGFVENWLDPTVDGVALAEDVLLEPAFWRGQFAETGGVARLGKTRASVNYTITSGNISSEDTRPELNFSGMPNAVLVEQGGFLLFNNVRIADLASTTDYQYSAQQPFVNQGVGYGLFPTIAVGPGGTVYMDNVTVTYRNPHPLDDCEQFTTRTIFGLRQAFGDANVIATNNKTAGKIIGPVIIPVVVLDGQTNKTVGKGSATYQDVTFACLPRLNATQAASGLSTGALAAAIAVPVAVVLAALLLACCCIRRRNLRRGEAASVEEERNKDLEAGSLRPAYSQDLGRHPEQYDRGSQGYRPSGSNPSANHSSNSTIRNFLAIPADTPLMEGILGTRQGVHSTGGSSGSSARQMRAGQAGSSGASILTPVGSMPLGVVASSNYSRGLSQDSGGRWGNSGSNTNGLSVDSHLQQAGMSSSAGGTDSTMVGPIHTGGTQGSGSSGQGGGRGSGSGGPGSSGAKQTVAEKYAGITSLLKARSDIAVLRELKIGPLLGRGSYGRVYRGRWKATTVAVKIIEHVEGAPGTASSGGKKISVGRESTLASSISHPNVVQTYHISTMTVAQRSALANTWLADSAVNTSGSPQQDKDQDADGDSSDDNNSHSSIEAQQKNLLETWMIMDFCEKGSLERAVNQGRFIRRSDKRPEMVGIYKALLDTASGLDYLHSVGIVHGDLKTANVLLKGSTKDPRGFMCKITDFGLSRVLDLDATHISTATYGTIVYMPKELLLSGRMTQATDIYSFGLMMWELYTSSRVFDEGLSIGQMFYMIAYQNWRPVIPDDCPPGYAELMTSCWDDDPEQRPPAAQLLRRLQKLYVQAKQELAASRQAEAAVASAGAAAAANMLAGGPGSADSAGSGSRRAAAAGTGSVGGSASGSGGGGADGAGPSRQKQMQSRSTPRAAPAASAFPGSDASMADSMVGALSPGASGGQVDGSGGLGMSGGLAMSGLTVSGGGSDVPKGSDGEGGDDGYKPYAAAVLQRKRSGSLATGSVASGNFASAHRSSAGRRQLQQDQQGLPSSGRAAPVPARQTHAVPGVVSPRTAVGSGGTQPDSSEAYDDPIPSESLLQNFTETSNIQDGGDTQDEEEEFSGYLHEPAAGAQRSRGAGVGGDSIEMSTRSNRVWAGEGNRWARMPVEDGPGPSELGRGSSSSYRDSFSTGTMPSVMADSWLGSQSSRQTSGRVNSSMNMGSLPPHSPTHGSGASIGLGSGGAGPEGGGSGGVVGQQGVASTPLGSRSYIMLQTVPERSGSLTVSEGAGYSPEVSVMDARAVLGQQVPQQVLQQVQGPERAPEAPAAAPASPSPFAALAHRAGSLFGPLR